MEGILDIGNPVSKKQQQKAFWGAGGLFSLINLEFNCKSKLLEDLSQLLMGLKQEHYLSEGFETNLDIMKRLSQKKKKKVPIHPFFKFCVSNQLINTQLLF